LGGQTKPAKAQKARKKETSFIGKWQLQISFPYLKSITTNKENQSKWNNIKELSL
jgi:hypothetical protein